MVDEYCPECRSVNISDEVRSDGQGYSEVHNIICNDCDCEYQVTEDLEIIKHGDEYNDD